ncbi:autotransporter outer membrane beta-barrel domain-containing protein [Polaromonas sp. LjRoot131]|uniref:autotransporter family protein n=1 Tax=Polaromonas sp. LjRoot131 TaxID=3342262 RepID=UPI003ED0A983
MSSRKKGSVAAPGGPATNKASGFAISATAFAVALLAASPQVARAANECGTEVAGQDTLTCSAANYATGIAYTSSNGLTLNLDNPAMVVTGAQGVSIQAVVGPVNPQLTVNVTNVNTITATGSAVTITNQGVGGTSSINVQSGTLTTTGAANTVSAGLAQTTGNAQVTLTGGQVLNTGTGGGIIATLTTPTGTGNTTVLITGGAIQAVGSGAQSSIASAARIGTSSLTMTGGSVVSSGANSNGLWARNGGTGSTLLQMSGGTVAATGNNGDGILASIGTGTYAVDISGGTATGGSGFGAAVHTSGAGGGTVNIGAGAVLNAGASGVALRDGDLNRDGIDEIGGNSVITTAGTLNGAVVLGGGTDTLTMTGGAINGNITGDGADALNLNLGTNSFTHGAAYAISGMNGIVMNSGTVRLDGTVAANTLNVKGGMLTLGNTATITTTAVEGGTLSVNGTLTGAVNVLGGRLQGNGRVGNTTNFAGGTIAPGNSIGKLLIAGNYVGSGGVLEIEGVLGGTGSPADRLVITGNASGTTSIQTINTGGTGALTGSGNTDGISIVQVGGTSAATTFQLAGGYAAAGPYQYQLRMFDPASSAASQADPLLGAVPFYDYRLQSVVDASGRPVAVPQIAGYQAMPTGAVRYGASLLDSVHKRQGELRDLAASRGSSSEQGERAFFVRVNGSRSDVTGNRASGYDQDIDYLQAGAYVFGRDMADGSILRIGGALSRGQSKLRVAASGAQVDLKGTTLALTSTYQTAAGWYLDGVAQLTDYTSGIQTRERGRVGAPDGLGLGLSVEGGYPMDIGGGLVIEPQAQLSYQKIKFDTFVDADRVTVDLQDGESLQGRVGARIKKAFNPNTSRQWTLYAEGNLVHEFLKDRGITASGISFASDSLGTSAQLGAGFNAQLGANTTLYASVNYSKGLSSGAADTWSGNLGMRFAF